MNERDLVLSMLLEIEKEKEFSHILLRRVLDKYEYLEANKKRLIKRLTEGTIERQMELDYVIDQFSKTKTKKMKPLIRNLLRMSVYQILYMDQIPDSAACNEAVKLASLHKFTSLKGFVNGVLRTIARNKEEISYPSKEEDSLTYLSVRYSMPEWIVKHFLELYPKEETERILQGLLEERSLTIRMREDLTKEERDVLKIEWEKQGVLVKQHPYLDYAFTLEKVEGVTSLFGFEEGKITVQDVSSMLVAEVAGIQEGMTIFDVCAAPGGKACHGALKLKNTGKVIACDLSEYKVRMIEENKARQRLDRMETRVWDAREYDPSLEEGADILFCDLPCSGLGVIGKKPEIKYRMQPEEIASIVKLQREILSNALRYLKKGGTVIYSTCTIHPKENREQVQWITENFPMEVCSMKEALPVQLVNEETEFGLQLLPGIHETDGFFLAKLRKKEG